MGRIFLLVSTDGLFGSISRYLAAIWLAKQFPFAFPYGTFTTNILVCLFIGVLLGFGQRYEWLTLELLLFLTTGFCGGFTRFLSFTLEHVNLLQIFNYLTFAIFAISSFTVGLMWVIVRITLTKIVL